MVKLQESIYRVPSTEHRCVSMINTPNMAFSVDGSKRSLHVMVMMIIVVHVLLLEQENSAFLVNIAHTEEFFALIDCIFQHNYIKPAFILHQNLCLVFL